MNDNASGGAGAAETTTTGIATSAIIVISGGGGSAGSGGGDQGGEGTLVVVAGPHVPSGPPSVFLCEIVGEVNADCHTESIEAIGEGPFNPPEGQFPEPEPAAPAPYVPSEAEIQATILAAFDNVDFPELTLVTAPPGDLDAPLITQLATFLWVDPSQWQPITSTAEIPGYLVVTATAEPVSMLWSGGETGPIDCYPPGIEWYPGAAEECTMTYKTSSATNDHELRLTVDWEVSFTCSAYCSGGDLPTVTHDYSRPVRVAEIQSIVTSGG